ncbi:h aca ribonucleoprotein complex subunit 3 [Vairimorpha ceranae]|uniref:H/ACA ribonucleoprotein complex subunit NOP10 n=1 Tax=Vairimorpha ceranae TaxID=40302 RepID=A0A0F9WEV8_9MICR|nr:h aca ribonucleoprotein complex subunit 3 [Vairimorpha ceranae]KKO75320.1 h aca ribonucleoprotein complex subunit 3 [Vairimorpha ceranae]
MFYKFINNQKVYTLKEEGSESAHPAKFSPVDQYSKYRVLIKERFNIRPFNKTE